MTSSRGKTTFDPDVDNVHCTSSDVDIHTDSTCAGGTEDLWCDESSEDDRFDEFDPPQCINTIEGPMHWSYVHNKYINVDEYDPSSICKDNTIHTPCLPCIGESSQEESVPVSLTESILESSLNNNKNWKDLELMTKMLPASKSSGISFLDFIKMI